MVNWDRVRRRLVERREAAGLMGKDAAAQAGVVPSYISNLERGTAEPPALALFAALAQIYGTSIDYLLGLTDDPMARQNTLVPEHVEELLRILNRLDSRAQRVVLSHARVVAADYEETAENMRIVGNAYAGIYSTLPPEEARALIAQVEKALGEGDVSTLSAIRQYLTALVSADDPAAATVDATRTEGNQP